MYKKYRFCLGSILPAYTAIAALSGFACVAVGKADEAPPDPPDISMAYAKGSDSVVQLDTIVVKDRGANLIGTADSSSEGFVGKTELKARPFLRRGELLEVVPGVVITQHSGSGKANQYFLRGFNLDHGTDFATSIDGMPVNMRTHAHGQGYSDLNFIIPEFIEAISYQKGTHSVENGDFSAAGAAQFLLTNSLDDNFLKIEVGENDYGRIAAGQTVQQTAKALTTVGFEATYENGPWQLPEHSKRYNAIIRENWRTNGDAYSLTALAYRGSWTSTDQIPDRAVTDGTLASFGYIDPTDGGTSERASLSFNWNGSCEQGTTTANLYAIYYRLNLFSNFTYFLNDLINGDQMNQRDRRGIFGGSLAHTWTSDWAGRKVDSSIGLQVRHDIAKLSLSQTASRQLLSTVRKDDVKEASAGIYARETVEITSWMRAEAGLRFDTYRFDVSSDNPLNSGQRSASIASPKLDLAFGPWKKTELYADFGYGFHSNDARGTVIRVNPNDGTPVDADNPLVRTKGFEFGLRTSAIPGLVTTVSLWLLDLDSELVFSGDSGDTSANGPTRRYGVEISNFYRPAPWFAIDLDLAMTRARYRDDTNGGRYIANSIGTVVTGGIVLGQETGWYGTLRGRFFGSQPLVEDNSVRQPSSQTYNGRVGWRNKRWELSVDVLNVFNQKNDDIAYYYTSRLPDDPSEGVDDIHFHPAEPRTFRATAVWKF